VLQGEGFLVVGVSDVVVLGMMGTMRTALMGSMMGTTMTTFMGSMVCTVVADTMSGRVGIVLANAMGSMRDERCFRDGTGDERRCSYRRRGGKRAEEAKGQHSLGEELHL
jgi:hypothetical protein